MRLGCMLEMAISYSQQQSGSLGTLIKMNLNCISTIFCAIQQLGSSVALKTPNRIRHNHILSLLCVTYAWLLKLNAGFSKWLELLLVLNLLDLSILIMVEPMTDFHLHTWKHCHDQLQYRLFYSFYLFKTRAKQYNTIQKIHTVQTFPTRKGNLLWVQFTNHTTHCRYLNRFLCILPVTMINFNRSKWPGYCWYLPFPGLSHLSGLFPMARCD